MLGNGESSSPSNTASFPSKLRYQDCINSQHELVTKHLGITSLEAVIGFSMGGQQAYYWATMYGSSPTPADNFVKNAISICSSAKTSYHNQAFLEGPISGLVNSVDYHDGKYRSMGVTPARGLKAFGRAYCAWAMSAAWFRQELWRSPAFHNLEDFIEARWGRGFETWDAEDVLILARMWQVRNCVLPQIKEMLS